MTTVTTSPRRFGVLFVFNAVAWTAMLTFWLTVRFIHSANPNGNPTGQEQIWFMLDGIDVAIQQAADQKSVSDLNRLCLKRWQYAAELTGSAFRAEPDACKPPENRL